MKVIVWSESKLSVQENEKITDIEGVMPTQQCACAWCHWMMLLNLSIWLEWPILPNGPHTPAGPRRRLAMWAYGWLATDTTGWPPEWLPAIRSRQNRRGQLEPEHGGHPCIEALWDGAHQGLLSLYIKFNVKPVAVFGSTQGGCMFQLYDAGFLRKAAESASPGLCSDCY